MAIQVSTGPSTALCSAKVHLILGSVYLHEQLNKGDTAVSDMAVAEFERGIEAIESIKEIDGFGDDYDSYSGTLHRQLGLVYRKHNTDLAVKHIRIAAARGDSKAKNLMAEYPADFADELEAKSSCFIATAVYGSPFADEVVMLKRFRDNYLLERPIGRSLMSLYYSLSPWFALFLQEHATSKRMIELAFLNPVLRLIEHLLSHSKKEVSNGKS